MLSFILASGLGAAAALGANAKCNRGLSARDRNAIEEQKELSKLRRQLAKQDGTMRALAMAIQSATDAEVIAELRGQYARAELKAAIAREQIYCVEVPEVLPV